MAATTIAYVMGVVEPCMEAWCPHTEEVIGGVTIDCPEQFGWQCDAKYDNDENELSIGWMNPEMLMQVHAMDVSPAACNESPAADSSLPCYVETEWLDTSNFTDKIDTSTVAVVPDDFIASCHQAFDEATDSIESDWLEDLDEVDTFLHQLESDSSNEADTVGHVCSAKEDSETINCSQLEFLLRSNDIAAPANSFAEANLNDDHPDVEYESDIDDSLHYDSENDAPSDDSDWSYSGKMHRRKSMGHKRSARQYTKCDQLVGVSSSSFVIRKKEQNKNAATRYRDRKRAEEQDNETECLALEKRNKELRNRVAEMTHEVAVLRKLIVDIFRTSPE